MTNANEHFGLQNTKEYICTCRPFPITYTSGVKDMILNCKAQWLIDIIIRYQEQEQINKLILQVWEVTRIAGDFFNVSISDGNDHIVTIQPIPFSDFPFDIATIWLIDDCLLLPHEYKSNINE